MNLSTFLFWICFCASLAIYPPQSRETSDAMAPRLDAPARRPGALRVTWVNEYQPNSAEKKLVQAASEDEKKFAEFLRQPNTGLFRLFPFRSQPHVVSVNDLRAGVRPGFSYYACMYSFSKKKHGHGLQGWVDPKLGFAELILQDGIFISGFMGESLGLLVKLGDVPLESVSLATAGVAEMANLAPPIDYSEALSSSKRNAEGFQINNFTYRSFLPASVNTTYALRSTSNKRADVLISFRVVRRGEADSLTILWRKLKSYPEPSWKRKPKQ